ncbi:hypothetical protein [Flindersiella endophytica]
MVRDRYGAGDHLAGEPEQGMQGEQAGPRGTGAARRQPRVRAVAGLVAFEGRVWLAHT